MTRKDILLRRIIQYATDIGVEINNVETYIRNPGEYVLESWNLKNNPRGLDDVFNVKRNSGFNYREVNKDLREYRQIITEEKLK
jgi:DNA-binding transcriptional MerR regulator